MGAGLALEHEALRDAPAELLPRGMAPVELVHHGPRKHQELRVDDRFHGEIRRFAGEERRVRADPFARPAEASDVRAAALRHVRLAHEPSDHEPETVSDLTRTSEGLPAREAHRTELPAGVAPFPGRDFHETLEQPEHRLLILG